jgi:hypothetical protein
VQKSLALPVSLQGRTLYGLSRRAALPRVSHAFNQVAVVCLHIPKMADNSFRVNPAALNKTAWARTPWDMAGIIPFHVFKGLSFVSQQSIYKQHREIYIVQILTI